MEVPSSISHLSRMEIPSSVSHLSHMIPMLPKRKGQKGVSPEDKIVVFVDLRSIEIDAIDNIIATE